MNCLRQAESKRLIDVIAWAILPEHFHLIFEPLHIGLSRSMQRLKSSFSAHLRKQLEIKSGRIWQLRFWDHVIRDEDDLNRHIDYVHYNPVKHGVAQVPLDYPFTSLQEFMDRGLYERNWGETKFLEFDGEYGE
jgi:putative transposase